MTQIGVIGAGQLGQMLGEAGTSLGVNCVFLDPAERPPAASVGTILRAAFDDTAALQKLAGECAAVTYEFENVPVAALESISAQVPVFPPIAALREAQDRACEKSLFGALGIPTPRWRTVDSLADLRRAADEVGLPLLLKTRRLGYDGKGQSLVRTAADFQGALDTLPNRPLIAEQWIAFDREISAIGVRARNGDQAIYPLTENVHRDGILESSIAPVSNDRLEARARGYLDQLMTHFDYVGVLALEMFVAGDDLLANEFAPRVHNSGHWTIEGATTSQFENHLRAVLGMPLGNTAANGHAAMLNLIGAMPTDPAALCAGGAVLHDYGKTPRRGRKLGHVTVVAQDMALRDRQLALLAATLRAG